MSRTAKVTTLILAIVMILAWATEEKYGISLLEYVEYSMPLNQKEIEYLRDLKKLDYGAGVSSAPLSFAVDAGEKNQGLIVDYMSYLSEELKIKINVIPTEEKEIIYNITGGDIDMSDIYITKERNQSLDYTQAFYMMKGSVIADASRADINRVNSLKGKKLIVQKTDYCKKYFEKIMEMGKDIEIVFADNVPMAIDMLMAKQGDAVAGDEMILEYYIREKGIKSKIKTLSAPLYTKDVSIAINEDHDMLLGILNKGILRMKKANILTKMQERWFGTSALTFNDTSRYMWIPIFFGLFLTFTILLYIWDTILRKQIKIATKEINNQKETLRAIIDTMDSSLVVVNNQNKIVETNASTEKLSGLEYEDIIGSDIAKLPVIDNICKSYEDSHDDMQKYRGKYYHIDIKGISEEQSTKLILCGDITKRVVAERKLRQENKMTAIGQLSAGLAHEIRNPLGLIRNYKYVISQNADDEMSQHAAEIIGNSVDRINGLIDNLLKFSRLSSDSSAWFDITNTINNILLLENKKAEANDIAIKVVENVPGFIFSNEEIIRLALFNLINNAIEALIKYETQREKIIEVHVDMKDAGLYIEVADNGAGIKEDDLENIFNPFFTTKENGTGLGLYIVSTELEKISGTISVNSRKNERTVFTIVIPAGEKEWNDDK